MILVTGATGHLGGSIVKHLLTKVSPGQIVALVRDKTKASSLLAAGVIIREGNYHDPQSLKAAFADVEKAVLVSSNDFNDRLGQHKNVIDAAKKTEVKHFVYTGINIKDVNQTVLRDFVIDHYQTEDYAKEKKLPFTFMRHNLYAEMVPFYIGEKVLDSGIFYPAGNGKVPFAMRDEMGEAIANVLTEDTHINKVYNISDVVSYSFCDIADLLSEISGKKISYTDADPAAFLDNLKNAGLPEMMVEVFMGFSIAMKNGDFDVPGPDLKTLLHRTPASLRQYLKKTYIDRE